METMTIVGVSSSSVVRRLRHQNETLLSNQETIVKLLESQGKSLDRPARRRSLSPQPGNAGTIHAFFSRDTLERCVSIGVNLPTFLSGGRVSCPFLGFLWGKSGVKMGVKT